MSSEVIVLFWDQLTESLAMLKDNPKVPVLLIEAWDDFTHVAHHQKKIVFLLSAMRHFSETLSKKRKVFYISLESQAKNSTFNKTLDQFIQDNKIDHLIATHPNEYRQLQSLKKAVKSTKVKLTLYEDERFICDIAQAQAWVAKYQNPLMETFYRVQRKKTGFLMEGDKPMGGKWNYDKENRKPPKEGMTIPHIKGFEVDTITAQVIDLVKQHFSKNFGQIDPFWYATTRKQALTALNRFIKHALPHFGDYQDAMLEGEAFVFHSTLSQYINVGLLLPMEVCEKVEQAYLDGSIGLNTAEGFIRQIIGWREYVRAIYWAHMPNYQRLNHLNYKSPLPEFYWSGKTKMNCLHHTIKQTHIHAYSHHIQRLMITGNFAMLIGVKPELIHEWYLIVYIDAFEWVEMPNTIGMATFADGGIVGTKPYASGGNYINKMSDFCKTCHYKVSVKSGENACPFNYLYWNFLLEHQDKLKNNARLRMPYQTLKKMEPAKIKQIQKDAKQFIQSITVS